MILPFTPGATVTVSATTASAATAMSLPAARQVMITAPAGNGGIAFIKFGASDVVATVAASCPVLPGAIPIFTVPSTATHIAVITGSSTATLYVTSGDGD